jgi:O-antigen/teichoic acid export membrane protein
MTWFVIFCCFIFLLVTMYIGFFAGFIGPAFRVGLPIVPILLLANLFLGVYVNLSVWYKLTDHTMLGAVVSVGGAIITIALNILWIPTIGYMGSAWATLICYGFMALASYMLGRRYYPVPYEALKVTAYIILAVVLYEVFAHTTEGAANAVKYLSATVFMVLFSAFVFVMDGRHLPKLVKG